MKNKRESGEVVVEASIIVTLVFMVITAMFCIGMVLYQRTAISALANRTATNIAQVYSNTLRDPFTGYIDPDNAYQEVTYNTIKSDAQLEAIREKGTAFVEYRLKKSQIIPSTEREVDVQIINKPNELLKGQIVVTIKDTYNVAIMGFFGIDGGVTVQATGRADCVDYLEYLQGVGSIANPVQFVYDECVVTFIKDIHTGGFHAAQPVKRGMTFLSSYGYTNCVMPATPTLNDMKFTGWVTKEGETFSTFSATTPVDENMTVYATWNCDVTLDPTGGEVNPSKITTAYHKPVTLPTPTRYGFAFEGWYTKKDGAGTKYVSNVTEIPGNITLYAKWRCEHAKFTKSVHIAATCDVPGVWRLDCDTCDYYKYETGKKLDHIKGNKQIKVQPSCTTPGWYVVNCKLCDAKLKEGEEGALGHNFVAVPPRAATCTVAGFEGKQCSRCGLENGKKLPATGHKWGARCGVKHTVGNKKSGFNMNKDPLNQKKNKYNPYTGEKSAPHDPSAGYKHSTVVECYLCKNCGAPYGGWINWKGQTISWGVICREHKDNAGVVADDAYNEKKHKVIKVH